MMSVYLCVKETNSYLVGPVCCCQGTGFHSYSLVAQDNSTNVTKGQTFPAKYEIISFVTADTCTWNCYRQNDSPIYSVYAV